MSMPFNVLSCTKCDFRSNTTICWGEFSYEYEGQLVPLLCNIAWCKTCATLVLAEYPAYPRKTAKPQHELTDNERLSLQRVRIWSSRERRPRCLTCGSLELVRVSIFSPEDVPAEDNLDDLFRKLEQDTHPGCGGFIVSRPSPFDVNLALEHRIYNTEGQLIRVLPLD